MVYIEQRLKQYQKIVLFDLIDFLFNIQLIIFSFLDIVLIENIYVLNYFYIILPLLNKKAFYINLLVCAIIIKSNTTAKYEATNSFRKYLSS